MLGIFLGFITAFIVLTLTVYLMPRPRAPESKAVSKSFNAPKEELFTIALQSVTDLGYKIDQINVEAGLLTFESGPSWLSWAGQKMSAIFLEKGNSTSISITGTMKQTGVLMQLYDWGETKKIAEQVLNSINEKI